MKLLIVKKIGEIIMTNELDTTSNISKLYKEISSI